MARKLFLKNLATGNVRAASLQLAGSHWLIGEILTVATGAAGYRLNTALYRAAPSSTDPLLIGYAVNGDVRTWVPKPNGQYVETAVVGNVPPSVWRLQVSNWMGGIIAHNPASAKVRLYGVYATQPLTISAGLETTTATFDAKWDLLLGKFTPASIGKGPTVLDDIIGWHQDSGILRAWYVATTPSGPDVVSSGEIGQIGRTWRLQVMGGTGMIFGQNNTGDLKVWRLSPGSHRLDGGTPIGNIGTEWKLHFVRLTTTDYEILGQNADGVINRWLPNGPAELLGFTPGEVLIGTAPSEFTSQVSFV